MEEYFNIIQSELLSGFFVAFQNGKGDLLNPNLVHPHESNPATNIRHNDRVVYKIKGVMFINLL